MIRVAITGIGAVTPLANNFQDSWEALKTGSSGIGPITRFDAGGYKWTSAGELRGFDAESYISKKDRLRLDSFIQYAAAASIMAVEDSGLSLKMPESSAVIIGSSRGGIQKMTGPMSAYMMSGSTICMAAASISRILKLNGHTLGISNACASGSNSIGEAFRLIKNGYSNIALAGASDAPINPLAVNGYRVSGALSKKGFSRPLDKDRDGFVISEGACVLVLEEYGRAISRNARIYAEVIAYGNSCDAYHETTPHIKGQVRAIKLAMIEGGLNIEDIDFISAHAAGTIIGDKTEAKAILGVFGKRLSDIYLSAIKSMTGHMLGASGAFEAAVAARSIYEGIIPPTINISNLDPDCRLNIVSKPIEKAVRNAVCNSFGFGGVNSALLLRKIV